MFAKISPSGLSFPGHLLLHALLLAALLAVSLNGASARANVDARASAQDMVRDASTRALDALEERRSELEANPARIYDFVEEYLLPHFDFEYSSRLVLGRHWRQASPEERERFQVAFQETLIRSYAASMLQYSDQEIEYLPHNEAADADETTVRTEIIVDSGKPIAVDYNLRRRDGGEWKVYDVIIDGISVVVNYRGTFASEIRRLGGLAPLIERMEERNRQGIVEPTEPAGENE